MAVRVGFASIDGNIIDQHFGHARFWQIYDIYEDDAKFIEVRKSYPACNGHCEGGFTDLIELLGDCQAIFSVKIGEGAAQAVLLKGIRVFEAQGSLVNIISALIEQNALADLEKKEEDRATQQT